MRRRDSDRERDKRYKEQEIQREEGVTVRKREKVREK